MNWFQENAVDLIGHALTFLGLVAAALTVVWQMRRQHESSLALQRESAREALMLRIYETLLLRVRALSDANVAASIYAFGIPFAIESLQQERAAGYQPPPLSQRATVFSDLHNKAEREFAELIVEFESWSIAFPGLHVFQVALSAAAYDVGQAFPSLFSALLKILPMDPPPTEAGKPTIIHPPPSPEALASLKLLIERYREARDEVGCYVQDLTIEAQNNLLSGLFRGKVPPRQPIDPRYKVISTDPQKAEELIRHFMTLTPWGENQAAIDAEVRREVQARTSS